MEQSIINQLYDNACHFYLDTELTTPQLTDADYDMLCKAYEEEYGVHIKFKLPYDIRRQHINEPMTPLNKVTYSKGACAGVIKMYIEENNIHSYSLTLKHDGSSIKAYYKNGKLQKILGTPDESYGFERTGTFMRFFPEEVDPSIKTIQGEVLVDYSIYGENSRSKANGLTNSKNMADAVLAEATIRVYNFQYTDGNWSYDRWHQSMIEYPTVTYNGRVLSCAATMFDLNTCPDDTHAKLGDDIDLQADGIVMYSDHGIQGFKMYASCEAITTVRAIEWSTTPSGGYSAVLAIDPVILNGKTIKRVSANGVNTMVTKHMGVGAEIKVTLAKLTIPFCNEVISGSDDFQFPTCECGYQFHITDVNGSVLQCHNEDPCELKCRLISEKTNGWDPEVFPCGVAYLFLINRLNDKYINREWKITDEFKKYLEYGTTDEFVKYVCDSGLFKKLSSLQYQDLFNNAASTMKVLREILLSK